MRELLDLLDDDTTLVTVNRRLSRAVTEAHAERQIAGGERAWRTPDVIPFSAWAERTWRACAANAGAPVEALLRPAQERVLWGQAVRENTPRNEVDAAPLETTLAARHAADAYAIVNAWDISLDAREFDFTPESRAFRTWVRAFEAGCARAGWIDAGRAASILPGQRSLAAAALRRRVVFAGFDVVTPQQQAIRAALSTRGIDVMDAAPTRSRGLLSRRAFDDVTKELAAAAAWARKALSVAPATRIGVVVPELHRLREAVERIFEEWLAPGCAIPGRGGEYRPFNLSFGRPLSRVSVVGDALLALKLGDAPSALVSVGRLLRSPYLRGGERQYFVRAAMDARLRDTGEPEVALRTLAARARAEPELHAALDAILSLRERAPRRQPLKAWSVFFSDWLACLGWPGERVLVSDEFQAVEAFRGLLDDLAETGAVADHVDFHEALSLLLALAEEQVFQPRAEPAPVQILGALETAGLTFDKLWVTGLHDGVWPPAPEPNAFLPLTLQRSAGLPQASPEGQLELATRRLAGWLDAAEEVVLSCALQEKNEPLRPSPLIAAIPLSADQAESDAGLVPRGEFLQAHAPALEPVEDARGPALAETRITRGGATLIRDQAACPFRAFARWRLGARAVSVAASPLDARARGNLVHAVLRDLWSEIRTHAVLLALDSAMRRQRVLSAVDRALVQERRRRPGTLRGIFAQVERERLCELVHAWLLLEKERPPFEVVAWEKDVEAGIGPLRLSIRPDRVDRLGTGRHLVVDYKTGATRVKDWFGDRPDDPQLALYTLAFESAADGGAVGGAAYARLRRGRLGFDGLAERDGLAEGVVTPDASRVEAAKDAADWKGLKTGWRKTLDALAAAFASGAAEVDPKWPRRTCSNCEVAPFCRIFEGRANAMSESDE